MTPTRGPRFSLLCFGFVVCGVVTVLPGPLLPVMAARWGLRDVQSGAFFAAEFAASTVGSIFSPHRLRRNLPLGYASMTAGVLLLTFAGGTVHALPIPALGHDLAVAAFALIGLGIGLSVTATNLSVGMMGEDGAEGVRGCAGGAGAGQGARAGERARRISIVNLWWGIGAVACPWMVAAAERGGYLRGLLLVVALGTAGMFVGLSPLLRSAGAAQTLPRGALAVDARILVFFAAFLSLYVGVETVVGGWITTYAHRFGGMTLAHASLTVSLYWLALLAGRWVGSVALKSVAERTVLVPGLGVALIAVTMLLAPHSTAMMLVAVVVAGAGLGPVFPIGISRMLARVRDHRNTGWVFAMCASGGAVLPWVTGLVSTRSGSLRIGFAVPVAALAAILVLAVAENAFLREPDGGDAAKIG
jgi:fucose permease